MSHDDSAAASHHAAAAACAPSARAHYTTKHTPRWQIRAGSRAASRRRRQRCGAGPPEPASAGSPPVFCFVCVLRDGAPRRVFERDGPHCKHLHGARPMRQAVVAQIDMHSACVASLALWGEYRAAPTQCIAHRGGAGRRHLSANPPTPRGRKQLRAICLVGQPCRAHSAAATTPAGARHSGRNRSSSPVFFAPPP